MTSDGFSPLFSVVVPSAISGENWQEVNHSGHQMGESVMAGHLSLIDDGLMEGECLLVQEMQRST